MNNENTTTKLPPLDIQTPKICIEARVREVLGDGFKISSDALTSLNEKVANLIDEAGVRCKANGRVTIQPQDF